MRKNGQWTEWTKWTQIQNEIMTKNGQCYRVDTNSE